MNVPCSQVYFEKEVLISLSLPNCLHHYCTPYLKLFYHLIFCTFGVVFYTYVSPQRIPPVFVLHRKLCPVQLLDAWPVQFVMTREQRKINVNVFKNRSGSRCSGTFLCLLAWVPVNYSYRYVSAALCVCLEIEQTHCSGWQWMKNGSNHLTFMKWFHHVYQIKDAAIVLGKSRFQKGACILRRFLWKCR